MEELLSIDISLKINLFQSLSEGLKDYSKKNPSASLMSDKELDGIRVEEEVFNRVMIYSSNIMSVGYDNISQTLEIEFLNGGIYQYFDVPENIFNDLMTASSHGQYLAQNIKGVYRYYKK